MAQESNPSRLNKPTNQLKSITGSPPPPESQSQQSEVPDMIPYLDQFDSDMVRLIMEETLRDGGIRHVEEIMRRTVPNPKKKG